MAFVRGFAQRLPLLRVPVAVLGLFAVFAIVYTAEVMASPRTLDDIFARFAFYPARYSARFISTQHADPGSLLDRAIPFVSYMFLHESLTHFLINVIWVAASGWIVARRFGGLLFMGFFIVCGVVGALTELAFNWGAAVPFVGASAAAAGLMGSAVRLYRYPPAPDGSPGPLVTIFSTRVLLWTLAWAGFNVVAAITGLGAGPGSQAVGWQAHLGGYAAGLLLAGPFLSARKRMDGDTIEGKPA